MANLRYQLVLATTIVIFVLATLFLIATFYIWWMSVSTPEYEGSLAYSEYIETMNYLAVIPSALIVILLLLCIGRRETGVWLSGVFVGLTLIISTVLLFIYGGKAAVGALSVFSSFYLLFLLGRLFSGSSVYSEKEKKRQKAGSLILHAGFSLLALSWVTLNSTQFEMPVFWLASSLIAFGMLITFL